MFKSQVLYVDCAENALPIRAVRVQHIASNFPHEGWVKANSNGFINHLHLASCGGLLCNYEGQFLGGFVTTLGSCPIATAEV